MRLSFHLFLLILVASMSGTIHGRQQVLDKCGVELSMIDNESGEVVDAPEVLLYRKGSSRVRKAQAADGKIGFEKLKNGEYGFLAIHEGYRNSFFRFVLDCGSLAGIGKKEVLLPLWKGESDRTIVLEFEEGEDYLRLKDLDNRRKDVSDTDSPTRVSSGVVNGSAIRLYRPEYPELARSLRLKGEVHVRVVIGFDGLVEDAEVVKGNKLFWDSVLAAVLRSEFSPTFVEGVPVKVEGIMVYAF